MFIVHNFIMNYLTVLFGEGVRQFAEEMEQSNCYVDTGKQMIYLGFLQKVAFPEIKKYLASLTKEKRVRCWQY